MSLHDDLRKQAWHLATKEPGRPSQASLRRAVSAAYYSLFHLFIAEATALTLGRSSGRRPLRHLVGRGFSHDSMADACKTFGGGTLPQQMAAALGTSTVPPELREIATTFTMLQQERHRADYDLSKPLQRLEVTVLLHQLNTAQAAWDQIRNDEATRLFLVVLPLWKQLKR